MSSQLNTLLPLIERALALAETQIHGPDAEGVRRLIVVLQTLRSHVQQGTLEPSRGVATLGLSHAVADWITQLDSPLLSLVAQIEERYQQVPSD